MESASKKPPDLTSLSNFRLGSSTTAEVDSKVCKVLLCSDLEDGYTFGQQVQCSRKGQYLMLAHAIHRQRDKIGGCYRYTRSARVVIKVFSNCGEAAKEAYLTVCANRGSNYSSRIVQLIDLLRDEGTYYIIEEYITGGDLFSRIYHSFGENGAPEPLARGWFHDLLQGVVQLKRCRLAHMDISPENILLDENDRCTLIDFGLSCIVPQNHKKGEVYKGLPCVGKSGYISPEVFRKKPYDPYAADVWSLGVVFYVILTGMPLYAAAGDKAFRILEKGLYDKLVDHYASLGCQVPQGWTRDMVRSMLDPIPSKRPSAEELLEKCHGFNVSQRPLQK